MNSQKIKITELISLKFI